MVQFVKPNLLGTKKEFLNRFANPITNGQFDDSTEYDVKLMKKRAYVLHKMLKGCVQRFDYSVLTPFLPPKQEYVIFVSLSEVQVNLYQHYLDNFARYVKQFLNKISKFDVCLSFQTITQCQWISFRGFPSITKSMDTSLGFAKKCRENRKDE